MSTIPSVGTHLIMNVLDVPDESMLTSLTYASPMIDTMIQSLPLHVLQKVSHQFQPYGYTMLYLLSESHYSIHTYPEYRSCYIDIFCCNKDFEPNDAISLVEKYFQTKRIDYQVISR
jgi:S-adenosylmethionine decarboxylase proenzyme